MAATVAILPLVLISACAGFLPNETGQIAATATPTRFSPTPVAPSPTRSATETPSGGNLPLAPTWTPFDTPEIATVTSEPGSAPDLNPLNPSPTPIFYPLPGLADESAGLTGNQPLTRLKPGAQFTLARIHFVSLQVGWGLETRGHILRTTDGGLSWKDVTPPAGVYVDSGFIALDENQAWATPQDIAALHCLQCSPRPPSPDHGIVWRTVDGGKTWQSSQPLVIGYNGQTVVESYVPLGISFADPDHGWLLVNTMRLMMRDWLDFYRTADGGRTWVRLYSPDSQNASDLPCDAAGFALLDARRGYLGGSCLQVGVDEKWWVRTSADGGATIQHQNLPAPADLPADFSGENGSCGAGPVVSPARGLVGFPFSCRRYDESTGNFRGAGFFYFSSNSGQDWITFSNPYSLDFINALTGWKLEAGSAQPGWIERTGDGGKTWERIADVPWQGQLDFVSEKAGWALAADGKAVSLLRTEDGGSSWKRLSPEIVP